MTSTPLPFIHQTPSEAIQQVVERQVVFEQQTFTLSYPGDPDALLDHPETHAAFHRDEYMPYWADLWPSAQMLGQALLNAKATERLSCNNPGSHQVLEVGCGVGLPGIVALSLGLRVTFSDYDRAALTFVQRNALANGFSEDQFKLLPMDWRSPSPSLQTNLLLASDVIYERRNIEPLITLIQSVLLPGGECWLVDPNRPFQSEFEAALQTAELPFKKQALSTRLDSATSERGQVVNGTLFRIYPTEQPSSAL